MVILLSTMIQLNFNHIPRRSREERRSADGKIGKMIKVVRALTQLALEIGTLIAVVKMIIESFRYGFGEGNLPYSKNITVYL